MTWVIDPISSSLEFSIKHLMVSNVRGRFHTFSGSVEVDEEHTENSTVVATIEARSIDTGNGMRDDHVRSPEFLDVENYPIITFHSTRLEKVGDSEYKLIGTLKIKEISHEVTLDIEDGGRAVNPASGSTAWGISAQGTINRKDWNLNWNVILETGGVALGDKIKFSLELELVTQEAYEAMKVMMAAMQQPSS